MTSPDWMARVAAVFPLLRMASPDDSAGEAALLAHLLARLPPAAARVVQVHPDCPDADLAGAGTLVFAGAGSDLARWEALAGLPPATLVLWAYNPGVPPGVAAVVRNRALPDAAGSPAAGCSFSALLEAAQRLGYRLIHVHGPQRLFFLHQDCPLPAEWQAPPLEPAELQALWPLLTDHRSLQATLRWPLAAQPAPAAAPEAPEAPDVSRAPWEVIAPQPTPKLLDLEGLALEVLADSQDAAWYQQRKSFEEKASLLYRFIADEGFAHFVDIGANVGYISLLAHRAQPRLDIVALEADPRLAELIRRNFARHGLQAATVVNAIVGSEDQPAVPFSLNPSSTLDNRVRVDKWRQIQLPMRRTDTLLERLGVQGKTFFKIDTQGFEWQVLQGLEAWLMGHDDWVLKMEFAPDWLRSQGTDPAALLDYLQLRYEFAEYPERIAFGTPGMSALFAHPVRYRQQASFLAHVVSLNRAGRGWVDLIVRPRP